MKDTDLRLDIGCGSNKKNNFIGVDKLDVPGVDFVVDFDKGRLPFEDHTVSEVYSSHCLEHLRDPTHIFSEIGRVCKAGARIELWTPYAFSSPAFIPDHKFFFTEEIYHHICVRYPDFWHKIIHSYWRLNEIVYICSEDVLRKLAHQKIPAGFAILYFKDICLEFGVIMGVMRRQEAQQDIFPRYVATSRGGERIDITAWWQPFDEGDIDFMSFHRQTKCGVPADRIGCDDS